VIGRLAVGGPSLNATLLTDRLDRARFSTTLVAGTREPGEADFLELHGRNLPVELIPDLGRKVRPLSDLRAFWRLVRLIRRERPHIVHTHAAKAGAVGRAAAIVCRVPVVVHTYHGHVLREYFSPAKTAIYRGLEAILARGTDRLLAVSDRVKAELVELGVGRGEQYQTLRLGFNLTSLLEAERRRGELRAELQTGDAPLVGIVARLAPIKAHEVFLAVAARVRQSIPRARFLIVGDGESRPFIERTAAKLGLVDAVLFLGWRADIDRVYADLDVVVLTSRNEGSPVALIEAMAAGVPVVSTDVGGVADVVTHGVTGLLAPMDDDATLAAHVVSILGDAHGAREMGQRGRRHVVPIYSAERLVSDIETLYLGLLQQKGVPTPFGMTTE
jgi:glycosyltransferase involved in cell wall biosynthesis